MRKFSALFFLVVFLLAGYFYFVVNINAAEFSQAFVRLDRTKINTALSGSVCAKPSSGGAGTESKVLVAFPSDFDISSVLANWTTDTSNLPAGSTSWPGVSAIASSVTGQTVTFSSSDLTNSSALYCFNFTGASSTTSPSAGDDKNGNVMTRNNSNSTIDSSTYALSISNNDQITVSGTVPATPSDFSAVISKLTPGTEFAPLNEIEYQITYGSDLSYSTDLTVEASWSQGTIDGDSTPSVDVLDYVSGSASDAYGSAPPVVDTVNRKITWDISSFPAATNGQIVTFKLKTTSNYTGSPKVAFTVSGRLLPPGTSTPYSDSTSYYQYPQTSTGGGTTTPTPTQTPVTPTQVQKPEIKTVEIREITSSLAKIFVETNIATFKVIKYGKSISNLNQSSTAPLSISSLITLSKLTPETKYYFKIYATDSRGNEVISDFYTFTTAKESELLQVDLASLVATSSDTILSLLRGVSGQAEIKNNYLVVPQDTVFQFKFSLKNRVSAKKAQAIVRNKNVLGVNTFIKIGEASSEIAELIEVEPGVYSGNLKTKTRPGNYVIYARITDFNGNITEQKIADLKVINKFKVVDKAGKPIEGARVFLSIFNPSTKIYQIIPSSNILAGNPIFTNPEGKLDLVLPQSKYKAEVSALGFSDQTVEFEIGIKDGQEFPVVHLEKTGITILGLVKYYLLTISDVLLINTNIYAQILTGSSRFFDLISALILGSLVFLTFFAFSKKHHVPLSTIHSYFYYLLDHKGRNAKYITGVVYDEGDKPIPLANVYLSDRETDEIIASAKTNKIGEFYFKRGKSKYFVLVMKKGFETTPPLKYEDIEHVKFKVNLKKSESIFDIPGLAQRFISSVAGMSFEISLVISLAFEVLFLNSFGLTKTLPFLLVSVFNFLIWTLHLRHLRLD